ncbi:MAG: acyl-CoA desaturase [Bacteroidetes bacterium]|nr:acyl-CoA desaturase [Bacteroidota bacterium]
MEILLFIVIHWYLSLFSQTVFLHRYAAHKMFTMSPFMEKLFFVFTFLSQGSSYLSPYAYGIMHRMHHAYADTKEDPHSPKYDKNLFAMMWRTKNNYNDIFYRKINIDSRFTQDIPEWNTFDQFASYLFVRILWALAYIAFYIVFAPHWWMYLLLPVHILMGPIHGAIINWFAHKYGYINFKIKDTSKNFLPFDFLMLGESYHNNHHKNSKRLNFGYKWFEIDFAYVLLKFLSIFKVVHIKKV